MTIDELARLAGGITALARIAGVGHSAVCGWRDKTGQIPVKRALLIAETLEIPLHEIRPDVWSPPDTGAPKQGVSTPIAV